MWVGIRVMIGGRMGVLAYVEEAVFFCGGASVVSGAFRFFASYGSRSLSLLRVLWFQEPFASSRLMDNLGLV
jgi:hypothetical protein